MVSSSRRKAASGASLFSGMVARVGVPSDRGYGPHSPPARRTAREDRAAVE